jgi:aminoglycoside/choline kinase family phosphotransferase
MDTKELVLRTLVAQQMHTQVARTETMRAHASARCIYRLHLEDGRSVVGIFNENIPENKAFVGFCKSFHQRGLPVPAILASNGEAAYIESDLGDATLMDHLVAHKNADGSIAPGVESLYRQAVLDLIRFQTQGMQVIDAHLCYQGTKFNGAAIERDTYYFLDEYVARIGIHQDKSYFSEDIKELCALGEKYTRGYFMFRDFQSRNIMVQKDTLSYIDFQSGREGPLQYDLASLLFQSQANLPYSLRESLLYFYLENVAEVVTLDTRKFKDDFMAFVLVRALQNLGAYGKLGLEQGKIYFKESIPFALKNCQYILDNWPKSLVCKKLRYTIEQVIQHG